MIDSLHSYTASTKPALAMRKKERPAAGHKPTAGRLRGKRNRKRGNRVSSVEDGNSIP